MYKQGLGAGPVGLHSVPRSSRHAGVQSGQTTLDSSRPAERCCGGVGWRASLGESWLSALSLPIRAGRVCACGYPASCLIHRNLSCGPLWPPGRPKWASGTGAFLCCVSEREYVMSFQTVPRTSRESHARARARGCTRTKEVYRESSYCTASHCLYLENLLTLPN